MTRPYGTPTDPVALVRLLAQRLDRLERQRLTLPVYTTDPAAPQEGEVWVRSDTNQLCYVSGGVTKRLTGT